MGTLVGHVAPGLGFFVIGLWHLFNHIKLHCLHPNSYTSSPWFPTPKVRYMELFLIMIGSSISISMELFVGPQKHQPFDPDGTIPTNHLHNFEHSTISLSFFTYAAFALILDKTPLRTQHGLTHLLGALAFAQEFLLFHFHSTDHKGMEGQYHFLLQIIIFVCLVTVTMEIGLPRSFLVSFVRSLGTLSQGVWFIVLGIMLYTPQYIPKGCFIYVEDGRELVQCSSDEALHRAKSLINLLFSWFLIVMAISSLSFYLFLVHFYGGKVEYSKLTRQEEEAEEDEDLESQKRSKNLGESNAFIQVAKSNSYLWIKK